MSATEIVSRLSNATKANLPIFELAEAIANAADAYDENEDWLFQLSERVCEVALERDEARAEISKLGVADTPKPENGSQAMDEIDRLRAECQLQRNLLGNATGAAIDVGLAGDVTAHDAIYLLAAERAALKAENSALRATCQTLVADTVANEGDFADSLMAERDVLRQALVKWINVDDAQIDLDTLTIVGGGNEILLDLIPSDLWGLGVTGGEPER